jgi:hypothetical protein
LDDRLVARHARQQSTNSQSQKIGKRVSFTLGTARIVNAFKEFQQRALGIHASVLIGESVSVMSSYSWI